MAEALLLGALTGSLVDKLLTAVLKAASLAKDRNKNFKALHSVLVRLQPVVDNILKDKKSNSEAASKWLKSLQAELEDAKKLLENETRNKFWNLSYSKQLLKTTTELRNLLSEVGLLQLEASIRVEQQLKDINANIGLLTQMVRRQELAEATRNAFFNPTHNFGSRVGTITRGDALRDIKNQADEANEALVQASIEEGKVDEVEVAVGLPVQRTALRRQDTGVFGGDQVVEQVKKLLLLEDDAPGANRWLGLWATGGAGKTHTTERVYNTVQNHFTGGHFWLTIGRQRTVRELLEKLKVLILMPEQSVMLSDDELKNRLCNHLLDKKEKMLLVLDDVWEPELLDWMDVLPRGRGNRILVTTRISEMLDAKHATKVPVPLLSKEHSWQLFSFHAFRAREPWPTIRQVAEQIVDECKGLPLALKVIGGTMASKKSVQEWQLALQKLKNAEVLGQQHEKQLFLKLQPSVDDLSQVHPHLKDCFFYFAAFPEDAEIEVTSDLLALWVAEGIVGNDPTYSAEDKAFELLGWLIARSLVELQEGSLTYMFKVFMKCKVHDVLRDLARYNLQHNRPAGERDCLYEAGRPKDFQCFPKEWLHSAVCATRLSLMSNNMSQLPSAGFMAPQLKVLLLRNNPIEELPSSFLRSLNELRVVDIRGTSISELPSSIGQLKKLVVLQLNHCSSLALVPSSIGELKSLRELHLASCKRLPFLPSSYSKLTSLERLDLSGSPKIWTGSRIRQLFFSRAEISDMKYLVELRHAKLCDMSKNPSLSFLKSLKKLQSLQLDFPELESFPTDVQGIDFLEELTLTCARLRSLPDWILHCTSLRSFTINQGGALSSDLPALDRLPNLRELFLTDCCGLTTLPSSFGRTGSFPALEELSMYACDKIDSFPVLQTGSMPKLLRLNLSGWAQLKRLPESLQQLKTLRSLVLSLCFQLENLDASFDFVACFPDLEELELDYTKALKELPSGLACLTRLRKLWVAKSSAKINAQLEELKNQGKLEIKM